MLLTCMCIASHIHFVLFCFQAEAGLRDYKVTGVQTCFFFFQAEDGIRDYKVTGVQTCALPISSVPNSIRTPFLSARVNARRWCSTIGPHTPLRGPATRSEERRVGKECRSRWSPYH